MEQITINYKEEFNESHGKMTIDLDAFFPCAQVQLNKLFKVISLDWRCGKQLTVDILDFCKEKKEICESNKKFYAKKYSNVRQCRLDCETRIKERKASNGVPLTKDQVKEERERKKLYLESEREYSKEFRKNSKTAEQLKRNIEQIEQYKNSRYGW